MTAIGMTVRRLTQPRTAAERLRGETPPRTVIRMTVIGMTAIGMAWAEQLLIERQQLAFQ